MYLIRKLVSQRDAINRRNRKALNNTNISIVASTCNGGVIAHDLGLRFNSPFVNLWIRPKEYIRLLSDLRGYLSNNLVFIKENNIPYPIALLGDVRLYFQHFESERYAEEKWKARVERVDYDNIAVFFTDRDGCTDQDLLDFDALPYARKVVFTHRKHPEIKSAYFISGFENDREVGILSEYRHPFLEIRYLDDFNYVEFFNDNSGLTGKKFIPGMVLASNKS